MTDNYNQLETRIFGPLKYIAGYGILEKAGYFGSFLGKKALIVASKSSMTAALDPLTKSLDQSHINWDTYLFTGFPSRREAQKIADRVQSGGFDFLIGAGGGRVIDVTKYAADLAGRRLILVPTISATNASLRVNSIEYDDNYRHTRIQKNRLPACFTLADLKILSSQPVRYLESGILDTLVRYIEMRPYLDVYKDDLNTKVSYAIIHEAYQFLLSHAHEYLDDLRNHRPTKALTEAIHCVIGVCSLSANYTSADSHFGGLAHATYYGFTQSRENHNLLHGEVIGFGIITQLFALGYPLEEIKKEYDKLRLFDFDYSLKDCGIETEEELDKAVDFIWNVRIPKIAFLHPEGPEKIREAIVSADAFILNERRKRNETSL